MSGKRVRITPETTSGGQVPVEQLKRLGDSAGKAADSLGRASDAAKKSADEAAKAQERANEAFKSSAVATVTGVASGAIQALGQPGGGAQDAFLGGIRSLQAALPGLGATLGGAVSGPFGAALGAVAGTAASAGLNAKFGPEYEAREQALSQVNAAYGAAAAQGVQISKEELVQAYAEALRIANTEQELKKNTRAATGAF